jgi:hypothetical protein
VGEVIFFEERKVKSKKLGMGITLVLIMVFPVFLSGCWGLSVKTVLHQVHQAQLPRVSEEPFYVLSKSIPVLKIVNVNLTQGILIQFNLTYTEYVAEISGKYEKPSGRVIYKNTTIYRNELKKLFKAEEDVTFTKTNKTITETSILKNTRVVVSVGSSEKTVSGLTDSNGIFVLNNNIQSEIKKILNGYNGKDFAQVEKFLGSLKQSSITIPSENMEITNLDLSRIDFVNENITLMKKQVEAQKAEALAEAQRREEERTRSIRLVFDLWDESNKNLTKAQLIARAREVLKVERPTQEGTGDIDIQLKVSFPYDDNTVKRFPENLTSTELFSSLPNLAPISSINRAYKNVQFYLSGNRLFCMYILWDFQSAGRVITSSAEFLELMNNQYGQPEMITRTIAGSRYAFRKWETPDKIIYCYVENNSEYNIAQMHVLNKQLLK